MRPSVLIATIPVFVGAVVMFSRVYNTFLGYIDRPTPLGLLSLFLYTLALLATLTLLGFIMYATERRLGNVKVKNALFERLLGYPKDAELPSRPSSDPPKTTVKEKK